MTENSIRDARDMLLATDRTAGRRAKGAGIRPGTSIYSIDQLIALAQAHAFIATAERRPQFVQVGSYAIRADAIAVIYHGRDNTTIFSETGAVLATLSGKELAAFLNWWNEHADVARLPQAPDATDPTAATAYNDDRS